MDVCVEHQWSLKGPKTQEALLAMLAMLAN